MFERYLTDAVTSHFGRVVENLDADKVRVSAWNGELVLEDLALRTDALQSFAPDCPVELAYGRVGNLEMRIPWTVFRSKLRWRRQTYEPQLLSTNCSVVLSDVNILITPRRRKQQTADGEDDDDSKHKNENGDSDSTANDAETHGSLEERRLAKERQVQHMLDANLLRRVTESSISSDRWSWVREYLSSILSTLSVTVKNIHIRYEDPGTCMGFVWTSSGTNHPGQIRHYRPAFSVGITLQEFSVESLEGDEEEEQTDAETAASETHVGTAKEETFARKHKMAAAKNLAVYWDSDAPLMVLNSEEICSGDDSPISYSEYYTSAFQVVNKVHTIEHVPSTTPTAEEGDSTIHRIPFCHEEYFNRGHSYLLNPISPSVKAALVSEKISAISGELESAISSDAEESTTDTPPNAPNSQLIPPSSMQIDLPPCNFTLARSTLLDTAYFRKSLSVWKHTTAGILSEASLRRLAKLRPKVSPLRDPKSWWKYSFQATLALSRTNQGGKEPDEFHKRRRRGWIGLIEALRRRKKYLEEYDSFARAYHQASGSPKDLEGLHARLLAIEDQLVPSEIVAFRLAVYETIKTPKSNGENSGVEEQTTTGWLWGTTTTSATSQEEKPELDPSIFSSDHRIARMTEIAHALERERVNVRKSTLEVQRLSSLPRLASFDLDEPDFFPPVWKASVVCTEFAIQVNDVSRHQVKPIVRMSSAWVQDQIWYRDGSWDIDGALGSVTVRDLTAQDLSNGRGSFPNLIGRKQSIQDEADDQILLVNGTKHYKSIAISVRRKLVFQNTDGVTFSEEEDRGSNTKTQIRIQPMEVIYSTVPVQSAMRVLGSVKTPEIVDDYHRMVAAAHGWRERQKTKFLEALAHKRKKIIIDVDVGAPELLVPEDLNQPSSPMLAIDLGRFRVFKEDVELSESDIFDDKWRIVLSNIQVQSTTIDSFLSQDSHNSSLRSAQHLVEPFSLDLALSTKVASQNSEDPEEATKLRLHATLPRLAFNISSSSIRLLSRLRRLWRERQLHGIRRHSAVPATLVVPRTLPVTDPSEIPLLPSPMRVTSTSTPNDKLMRTIEFDFTAPVISLHLEDDSIETLTRLGNSSPTLESDTPKVPLIDLAVLGIRGNVRQETLTTGTSTTNFDARLHSLGVIDLFQPAGKDFALLMSSSLPDDLDGLRLDGEAYSWNLVEKADTDLWTGEDLVTISYATTDRKTMEGDNMADKLSIGFHELYLEWNPETIASIHCAIRVPEEEPSDAHSSLPDDNASEDEFFDALEDEFHETNSLALLSEVSSQESKSFETAGSIADPPAAFTPFNDTGLSLYQQPTSFDGYFPKSPVRIQSSVAPLSTQAHAYPLSPPSLPNTATFASENQKPQKGFDLSFRLSKLRMSFNKESRHRKVMIAQMDGTTIRYQTRTTGGSRTKMSIGNLVFSDPSSKDNATLYGQILGLKNTQDTRSDHPSSLLQMEILINPRARSFQTHTDAKNDDPSRSVSIDRAQGVVVGCNYFVRAKFSPMRFVVLEQLWFEIVDYFFEGVIGSAVWGGKKNSLPTFPIDEMDTPSTAYLPGSDASGFSFTRFNIQLVSPELLFPVAYRSPQFLKMELSDIKISNHYDGTEIEGDSSNETQTSRMQWFNNCTVSLRQLRLFSWTGNELGDGPVMAHISLRWPSGPKARLVIPKWRVNCVFDSLNVSLQRSDYALLQQILSSNIGEQSRHLAEWRALQRLSYGEVNELLRRFLVHFGYDKKDVTPTTYDLKITIPLVNVRFVTSERDSSIPIATARLLDLVWSLTKEADLVVKQRASCDVDLTAPSSSSHSEKLLSSWKYDQDELGREFEQSQHYEGIPEMTYTSTTQPFGDNVKTLEIVDACIYAAVPEWKRLSHFFSALPDAELFNTDEIGSLIQVGDRWYRIGGNYTSTSTDAERKNNQSYAWMDSLAKMREQDTPDNNGHRDKTQKQPDFQFRILLTVPRIILSSAEEIESHVILRMNHLDFLHTNSGLSPSTTKSFLLDEIEVYTLSRDTLSVENNSDDNSLIRPWSVGGTMAASKSSQDTTTTISADVLRARAAYSDMTIAIEVCLGVFHSFHNGGDGSHIVPSSASTSTDVQSISPSAEADPFESQLNIECDGFELRVADDSGRHFAGTQDLIVLALGKISFNRHRSAQVTKMKMSLHTLDLYDCLQSVKSRFHTAASTRLNAIQFSEIPDAVGTEANGRGGSIQRCYGWDVNKSTLSGDFKYRVSQALASRLESSSADCLRPFDGGQSEEKIIQFSCELNAAGQTYHINLGSLSIQWNPSTVIAIQRFLGRLRKDSKSKIVQVYNKELDEIISGKSAPAEFAADLNAKETRPFPETSITASISLDGITLCLNKEHHNRRLLELSLSDCWLELDSSSAGVAVNGHVGDLNAKDSDSYAGGILEQNRSVLSVLHAHGESTSPKRSHFLEVRYRTFKNTQSIGKTELIPSWVCTHVDEIGGIDDYLIMKVAATEFTYLKERTEELIDYLSNGLPGKGMGVTSRAAKGFIKKRILSKSFLEFQNDSPQVFVPQNENEEDGMMLKLGDFSVKSYFEQERDNRSSQDEGEMIWWRVLSLQLSRSQSGVRKHSLFKPLTGTVDLGIDVRKPTSTKGGLCIQGELSFVDLDMKYSDYILVRKVIKENIGKKVDTERWDNVEKAYWSEHAEAEESVAGPSPEDFGDNAFLEGRVTYSSNARFIRYGKAGKRQNKISTTRNGASSASADSNNETVLDLQFRLDGLSVKLRRDDRLVVSLEDHLAEAFHYDIILLRVQLVEISLNTNEAGDASFHLSLFRLGLFDLGDLGRLARERYYHCLEDQSGSPRKANRKGLRKPCPFFILAEGYAPDEAECGRKEEGPQFVVTIDRCASTAVGGMSNRHDLGLPKESKITIARVVINYLSLNILVRPLKETVSFLFCEWDLNGFETKDQDIAEAPLKAQPETLQPTGKILPEKKDSRGLQLKVVAHYPRVFFLADESDSHSRALVLRGLAVVNVSKISKQVGDDFEGNTSIDAQLHSMETYINADVHSALSFKNRHGNMVGASNQSLFPPPEGDVPELLNALGIALIQPVTMGIELSETKRRLFPTQRSVSVNIDAVSTMISFEDMNLIQTVLNRLSSSGRKQSETDVAQISSANDRAKDKALREHVFSVIFHSLRLGLGLKTMSGHTVVTSIQNEEKMGSIQVGDRLVAINEDAVMEASIDEVVALLSTSSRPVTLRFSRQVEEPDLSDGRIIIEDADKAATPDQTETGCISTFTIDFPDGLPDCILLEKNSYTEFPVVKIAMEASTGSSVDPKPSLQPEVTARTLPRSGAIVVAINGNSLKDLGGQEAFSFLQRHRSKDLSEGTDQPLSVSFREIDSSLWGENEKVDVSSAGFAVSFIDDLDGRDMPIFRAQMSALEIHAERGIGSKTHIIEVHNPSVLNLADTKVVNEEKHPSSRDFEDMRSEVVLTFNGMALSSIDYFHPRIAAWEPLLEPSQLHILFEKQSGSSTQGRPGQVAIELSDRMLRDKALVGRSIAAFGSAPEFVAWNLTDASVEVLVKAFRQWRKWKSAQSEEMSFDDQKTPSLDLELRESTAFTDQDVPTNEDWHQRQENGYTLEDSTSQDKDERREATQKAAQAALVFAKKRGAETSQKSDSAKPFVLRNRTGVSIAFVQQNQEPSKGAVRQEGVKKSITLVGEYDGLEEYDVEEVQELADQDDAKFNMDIVNKQEELSGMDEDAISQSAKKVRNYEGRFPSLTISIQAVTGVVIEPLTALQVYREGSTVRQLRVRRDDGLSGQATEFFIPVVWRVEIVDNRRVLTLSTAVRVGTTAFNTRIDIGVRKPGERNTKKVGTATPDAPFYLPLWLALKLEAVDVHARPSLDQYIEYDWGDTNVLRFCPRTPNPSAGHEQLQQPDTMACSWAWEETFSEIGYIKYGINDDESKSLWLAAFGRHHSDRLTSNINAGGKPPGSVAATNEEEYSEIISVVLDSNVTLRNMLPMHLDWQITSMTVGGAPVSSDCTVYEKPVGGEEGLLGCGDCTEVFACNYDESLLRARFKEPGSKNWSSWAPLNVEEDASVREGKSIPNGDDFEHLLPCSLQVNVQVTNGSFGVPLTIGVRVVPKVTSSNLEDSGRRMKVYGIEIVTFAELWIRNLTSLPLNFGCPSYQLHGDETKTVDVLDTSASRFNAETALMEIANLLEAGEISTGLSKKAAREVTQTGTLESLPNQECRELTEEVFEYLEIDFSTVKRRWWASESYDMYRMNITNTKESSGWSWIDENWVGLDVEAAVSNSVLLTISQYIDCSGDVQASLGGWESCRNLLAGAGSFSGDRSFDPAHSIRRRRFFRTRTGRRNAHRSSDGSQGLSDLTGGVHGGLQAFHQPLVDSFTREQLARKKSEKLNDTVSTGGRERDSREESNIRIAVKCGDGKWSLPVAIPDNGTAYGLTRVLACRWPTLAKIGRPGEKDRDGQNGAGGNDFFSGALQFKSSSLSPVLHELCYAVSHVEGDWGEFSRTMSVSPRFLLRNDSSTMSMEVKQAGTSDSTSIKLPPGTVEPFYWADFRLPGLVSVSPCINNQEGRSVYGWSGGFDICNLGMIPLRVRKENPLDGDTDRTLVRSIRALVEIRPGTGGFGINVSFRDEDPSGDGSLFRIENHSPFPVWFAQDGVLANPTTGQKLTKDRQFPNQRLGSMQVEAHGELIMSSEKKVFALDVPYRQGKYAHRKEASLPELLRLRLALAPLYSRAGIETVKVIGLTSVGESIRINPSKLVGVLDGQTLNLAQSLRVLGVIASDGPTRVLKFFLIRVGDTDLFSNPFRDVSYMAQNNFEDHAKTGSLQVHASTEMIRSSMARALELLSSDRVLDEASVKRKALMAPIEKELEDNTLSSQANDSGSMDQIYSVRAEFSGFVFSLVDSAPSEIAVVSLKKFNTLARWNQQRTNEASLIASVGWLQVDNHVPNAPFKVAVKPDPRAIREALSEQKATLDAKESRPLLVVAVAFTPRHKSGIVCLRSVTVAPRNLIIALDLAFLVRLQRFFSALKDHVSLSTTDDYQNDSLMSLYQMEQKRSVNFPKFDSLETEMEKAAAFGSENQKMYFHGLTILPAAITLSVAPARALTASQAALEGKELAAIHQAVRKGDILVGSSSALVGVRVGRKNTTPLAVVRGVFKSIVVDALLRLDGASLNFSGVTLRNHLSTGPQLGTFLATHYLASLRQNVPALLGSLAAFGNPLGLIRGIGDGVSDFVSEPVRGLKKSVKELDPSYLVDGVARGTESLARHTVGGFADSASLLTETFSKNMAVLTLDRRYAQKRDRNNELRLNSGTNVNLVGGVESGFTKLVEGFLDGVTGVVQAPVRGAERKGIEGFAKGLGKGLLGLLVKPMIGISDAATDVMIGVKNTMENSQQAAQESLTLGRNQLRPRRPMYGRDKVLRTYKLEDAAAATLMQRTRCAGENYLSHLDMGDRVALFSVKRFVVLGNKGQELMALRYKHISKLKVQQTPTDEDSSKWTIVMVLDKPRRDGSEEESLACKDQEEANNLCAHIQRGVDLIANELAL